MGNFKPLVICCGFTAQFGWDLVGNSENRVFYDASQVVNQLITLKCHCDLSRIARKTVFGVSDQIQHKMGCTAAEDG